MNPMLQSSLIVGISHLHDGSLIFSASMQEHIAVCDGP